ncbi:MAG: hypothetical protein Q8P65_01360 [bacterium]|nr:hypothetical protein [bacterium]
MKLKYILIYIFAFIFISSGIVIGQSTNSEFEEIQNFKEKLASKVAELQKKEDKALSGFLILKKDKSLTIETTDNEQFSVELDDLLTKYFQVNASVLKEITLDDFEVDDYIIITGPISGKVITANNVYKDENYTSASGIVSDTGQGDFALQVVTLENETLTIDIETATKRKILNIKTLKLEDVGFSKIKTGDVLHFFYKKISNEDEKKYSATKILVIPQEYFSK